MRKYNLRGNIDMKCSFSERFDGKSFQKRVFMRGSVIFGRRGFISTFLKENITLSTR